MANNVELSIVGNTEDLKINNKKLEFWDRIHLFNKFLLEAGTVLDYSVASFDFKDFVIQNEKVNKFKNDLLTLLTDHFFCKKSKKHFINKRKKNEKT